MGQIMLQINRWSQYIVYSRVQSANDHYAYDKGNTNNLYTSVQNILHVSNSQHVGYSWLPKDFSDGNYEFFLLELSLLT